MAKKSSGNFDDFGGVFQIGADTNSRGNIPTGHFALDFAIHHGVSPENVDLSQVKGYDPSSTLGIPLGRVVELFGEEGSGKSSLAYRVCGYAQKMGHTCIWIDAENSFSNNLAEINGVTRSELLYTDLSNKRDAEKVLFAEDVLDSIIFACKKKGEGAERYKDLAVVVVDSVANLTPKIRMEADSEKITPGAMARVMSENLKKVVNYASKHQVAIIFINQIREKIGVMFGNPETTPGGKALKFAASLRIKVSKKNKDDIYLTVDGKSELIGGHAWVKLEKNRFSKPFKDAENRDRILIPIYYAPYFPNLDDMVFDVAKQMKIIRPYKSEFRWKTAGLNVEGDRKVFMQTVKFKSLLNHLILEVIEASAEQSVILPPELSKHIVDIEMDLEELKESGVTAEEKLKASEGGSDDNIDIEEETKAKEEVKSDADKPKSTGRGRKKKAS